VPHLRFLFDAFINPLDRWAPIQSLLSRRSENCSRASLSDVARICQYKKEERKVKRNPLQKAQREDPPESWLLLRHGYFYRGTLRT
jgi:hypothetical protein